MTYTADASFVLAFLLPDEKKKSIDEYFKRFIEGKISLMSSAILPFEVLNGLKTAVLQKRLDEKTALVLAKAFLNLEIETKEVDFTNCLKIACKQNITVYDASYVYLSQAAKAPLLSLDKKLSRSRTIL